MLMLEEKVRLSIDLSYRFELSIFSNSFPFYFITSKLPSSLLYISDCIESNKGNRDLSYWLLES